MTTSPLLRRLSHTVEATRARVLEAIVTAGGSVPVGGVPLLEWYSIEEGDPDAPRGATGKLRGQRPPTVYIFNSIGGSLGVTADRFKNELNAIDADIIHVRINSPGGSLFDGRTIMNTLRDHPAHIIAFVDGIAASAASIVILGADEIVVGPNAEIMIHDGSMNVEGDPRELAAAATFIERESAGIAKLYAQRTGIPADEIRDMMIAETWMFGDEAVTLGFADRAEELAPAASAAEKRMAARHDVTNRRYAGRSAAPAPQRRAVSAPARAETRPAAPVEVRNRLCTDVQLRSAAEHRRNAVRPGQGPIARRTAPEGVSNSRRVSFPAKMVTNLVEWNGQRRHQVSGHASVYETRYEMWDEHGPYWEIISRGAGKRSLAADPDVAYLVNHAGITMARTTNGSLLLREDEIGLAYDAFLNPKRVDVQTLVTAIEDEDITENSFAFYIPDGGGRWNTDFSEYRIDDYEIDRGDTSAVNYGANPYTDVAARSREVLRDVDHLPAGAARTVLDRLTVRFGGQVVDLETVYGDRLTRDEVAERVAAAVPVTDETAREEITAGRTITSVEAMLAAEGITL